MNQLQLKKPEQKKWFHNILVFLSPVGILYLTTVVGAVSTAPLGFQDFIPGEIALGGMILFVLNGILDYLRKLKG